MTPSSLRRRRGREAPGAILPRGLDQTDADMVLTTPPLPSVTDKMNSFTLTFVDEFEERAYRVEAFSSTYSATVLFAVLVTLGHTVMIADVYNNCAESPARGLWQGPSCKPLGTILITLVAPLSLRPARCLKPSPPW